MGRKDGDRTRSERQPSCSSGRRGYDLSWAWAVSVERRGLLETFKVTDKNKSNVVAALKEVVFILTDQFGNKINLFIQSTSMYLAPTACLALFRFRGPSTEQNSSP